MKKSSSQPIKRFRFSRSTIRTLNAELVTVSGASVSNPEFEQTGRSKTGGPIC